MFFTRLVASQWKVAPYTRYFALFTSVACVFIGILACIPSIGSLLPIAICSIVVGLPIPLLEYPWPTFVHWGPIHKFAADSFYWRAIAYFVMCLPCWFGEITIVSAICLLICAGAYAFAGLKGEKPDVGDKPKPSSSNPKPSTSSSNKV
eukprot:ANDGO_01224.mRNA.1 hypothetical protein